MLAGTRLLTPQGYRPVEELRRGDQVAALIGRGPLFAPIAWIGRRPVRPNGVSWHDIDPPVLVRCGAIGEGMPRCDVLLAPDHAIYIDGALFRAGSLINDVSIRWEQRQRRGGYYWGVRLQCHDLLVAENLPPESAPTEAAFTEVTTLRLTLVGAAAPAAEEAETVDFPSAIGWSVRWFRRRLLARRQPAPELAPAPRHVDLPLSRKVGLLDVDAEARAALAGLVSRAARQHVQLELANEPGLLVHMSPRSLHEVLDNLLVHAIDAAPGGHVLLGGMRHGGRVQIAVIDDGAGVDAMVQRAELRQNEEIVALLGGTLEIDSRPGEGTAVLVRLPEPQARCRWAGRARAISHRPQGPLAMTRESI